MIEADSDKRVRCMCCDSQCCQAVFRELDRTSRSNGVRCFF